MDSIERTRDIKVIELIPFWITEIKQEKLKL